MTSTSKTLGSYLLEALEHRGITQAFGIPGVHNIELYRALPERRIHHVGGRHEQALGFMADGYARAGGRPAACFTISGPGVTNIATAMAQAYADSIPMFVVASQNRRGEAGSGRGFLHEMPDQCAFAAQVSGFAHSLATVQELPEVLARAFARLSGARRRPVYLEIPRDLFAADASMLPPPDAPLPLSVVSGAAPAAALQEAARLLRSARRPVILAGGGAARAATEVRRLAEALQAPVVMTINGRGILPPAHPLGLSYSASLDPVREFIASADVTLAIGTEFGPTDYDMYALKDFPQPSGLVRIDLDPEQMVRNVVPQVPLLGDATACVASLLDLLQVEPPVPVAAARELAPVREAAAAALTPAMRSQLTFLELLRDALPGHLLVGDSTQPVYAGNLGFAAAAPGTWFNSSTGFGTLGYALPAANGASLAQPGRPVVALAGDGGLQFTLAEFGTLRDLNGWVAVIIWNNRGFGEIKTSMIDAGVKPQAVDLLPPQWSALAGAYGLPHRLVRDRLGLAEALRQFCAARTPLIIEIDADAFR